MKSFVRMCLVASVLALVPALMGVSLIDLRVLGGLLAITIIGEFGAIYYMRKNSSGDISPTEDEDLRAFKNVGSGPADEPPMPIDQTGNVFENARKIFNQDIEHLEDKIKE